MREVRAVVSALGPKLGREVEQEAQEPKGVPYRNVNAEHPPTISRLETPGKGAPVII